MRRTTVVAGLVGMLTVLALSNADDTFGGGGKRRAEFGPWTAAVNLGPVVNSPSVDGAPSISGDGLALYFHSTRQSGGAELDLYVSRRAAIDLPWEAPVSLGAVLNSPASDLEPDLSRDGRYLFFVSQRSGDTEIYVSRRRDVHDDFAWETPLVLPAPVNGPSFDTSPAYFEHPERRPQLYFASDRANGLGTAGLDIYVTELRRDGNWTTPTLVDEVNSAFSDGRPAVSADGLELVFNSNRDGRQDLFASRRSHVSEPWSTPEKLAMPVNTDAVEFQAALSANGRTLYFASDRPGGSGLRELYVSTRTKLRRRHD